MDTHRSGQASRRRPRGATLVELAVVLVVIGLRLAVAARRAQAAGDRHAARAAARDVALLLSSARQIAATSADGAAVMLDGERARVQLVVAGDTVRTLELAARHGVALRATRDSLAYDARGLGYGAANLSVVLARRAAAETLVVSRLGRVRRSGVF